ncbi:hypothetical protein VNO80_19042 [Phaseolus coccineus]|uniref:Uncharacterized protein n=1 Tax=Phaseolus coccineus TaxID=3886 RepID=A0AAN9MFQ2_PHACN
MEEDSVRGDDPGGVSTVRIPPNRSAPPRSLTGWTPRWHRPSLPFGMQNLWPSFLTTRALQRKGRPSIETVPADAASGVLVAAVLKTPNPLKDDEASALLDAAVLVYCFVLG